MIKMHFADTANQKCVRTTVKPFYLLQCNTETFGARFRSKQHDNRMCLCVLIFRGHQAEVQRATRGAAASGAGEGSTGFGSEPGWKQRPLMHEHLCGGHQPRRTSQPRWTHPSGR